MTSYLTAPAHELGGGEGAYVALPLRRENSALVGFVVLRTPRVLQRHVRSALARSLDALGLALAQRPSRAARPGSIAATGFKSGARRRLGRCASARPGRRASGPTRAHVPLRTRGAGDEKPTSALFSRRSGSAT